jgi:putative heme iron utilization protein
MLPTIGSHLSFSCALPRDFEKLRPAQFAAIFAVEKPSQVSGTNTLSFQFFDAEGAAVMKIFVTFGEQAAERLSAFTSLREQFRKK